MGKELQNHKDLDRYSWGRQRELIKGEENMKEATEDMVNLTGEKEKKKKITQKQITKDIVEDDLYDLTRYGVDTIQFSINRGDLINFIIKANNADPYYKKIDGKDIMISEIPYNANTVGRAIRDSNSIDIDNFDVVNREITHRINPMGATSIPVVAIKRSLLKKTEAHSVSESLGIKQYSEKITIEENPIICMNIFKYGDINKPNISIYEKDKHVVLFYLSLTSIMCLVMSQVMKLSTSDFNRDYTVKGMYVDGIMTIRATKKVIRVAENTKTRTNTATTTTTKKK